MKLDSEQQRQTLIQIITNFPLNGNLQSMANAVNSLAGLLQLIEKAEIEDNVQATGASV